MRLRISLISLSFFLLSSCGPYRGIGGVTPPQPQTVQNNPSLSISPGGPAAELSGTYDIVLMEFDSDPHETFATDAVVTTVMRNISVSSFGEPSLVQVAIDDAFLVLNTDGTYDLYYRFKNASGQFVEVGNFSEGTQSGTYKIDAVDSHVIYFFPAAQQDPGFAPSSATSYRWSFETGNLLITANVPGAKGEYLTEIKGTQ